MRSPRALVPTIRAVQTAVEQRVTGDRGLEQLEASPDTAGVKHQPMRCRTAKYWDQNSADRMSTGLKRARFVAEQKRGERVEWECHAPSYAGRAQGSRLRFAVHRGQGAYTTSGSGGSQRSDCLHRATPL